MSDERQDVAEQLAASIRRHLRYEQCRLPESASRRELYLALAGAVREQIVDRWHDTQSTYEARNVRRVGYLSLEYLTGRLLRSAIESLDMVSHCQEALEALGERLENLEEEEHASALGSGGLGRLAACFLDSLATLELPAWGYGLRYRFGLFRQQIKDGWQQEEPYDWLRWGTPWEVPRPEEAVIVSFFGHTTAAEQEEGVTRHGWAGTEDVLAVPYDVPVPGFRNGTVNTLRLWGARSTGAGLQLDVFHRGEFAEAHRESRQAMILTEVLYPAEHTPTGQELRLKQQHLLSSATLQDLLRRHLRSNPTLDNLAEKLVLQLNDTHPALAIPELMRLLMDVHGYGWEEAWQTTSQVFAYTNHTLQPEALETWPFQLLARLLPRHAQLIQEIDLRFQESVRSQFPGDEQRVARMALVGRGPERRVRMAHLSVVGSHSVNGVAQLHAKLLREDTLKDFADMYPERFSGKTNGITPRRWLYQANPGLAALITHHIGDGWLTDLSQLRQLEPLAADPEFRAAFRRVKRQNKEWLARYTARKIGVEPNAESLFSAQIKRIHEYKRQLLLALHLVDLYLRARSNRQAIPVPRTVFFAGKAAADYRAAKLTIKLLHAIAQRVNSDPRLEGRLKVAFLPNYGVSLAQRIVVAADVSEQISTAGHEASGTGNMKLSLNGALTVGTLDGANIEIREEVGEENFFLFGLRADQVKELRAQGYRPRDHYEQETRLREVIDAISGSLFCPEEPGLFHPLVDSLLERDEYLLLADFAAYTEVQAEVSRAFLDHESWTTKAILNVARMGKFSSDRTIEEYNRDIWRLERVRLGEARPGLTPG